MAAATINYYLGRNDMMVTLHCFDFSFSARLNHFNFQNRSFSRHYEKVSNWMKDLILIHSEAENETVWTLQKSLLILLLSLGGQLLVPFRTETNSIQHYNYVFQPPTGQDSQTLERREPNPAPPALPHPFQWCFRIVWVCY